MTAHEYLSQIRDYDAILSNIREELEELYGMASGISSPALSADKVQTSISLESPQERIIPKIEKNIRTYMDEENRYLRLRKRIINQINNMGDWRYTRILYLTYVKGYHSPQIADEMNYIPEHVRRVRTIALAEFENIYLREGDKC